MMPGYLLTCTLLALLAISVQGQPGPDQCETDPCNGTECSRFLNADCIIIVSLGECRARFSWKGKDVTNRCQARTCDSRQCGKNRECMEEVFPPSCPEDKPINTCRQYIRSKCVLQPFERPLSCDDIECGEGMMCRFRERPGEVLPVVRCVQATPQDCSELDCEEGFTCVMRNRRPVCVIVPTTESPFTTDVPVSPCDQITCDFGLECTESQSGPTCVTKLFGQSCAELDCLSIFLVCEQQGPNVASCIQPTECTPNFDARCQELRLVCGTTAEGTVTCTTPTSCEQLTCEDGFTCLETGMNTSRIAACFPDSGMPIFALTCENITCGQGQSCLLQKYPNVNLSIAQCLSAELINPIAAGIRARFLDCEMIVCPVGRGCVDLRDNGLPGGAVCHTGCNNITSCPGNSTCVSPPEFNFDSDFDSFCSPDDNMPIIGTETCSESGRVCPSGTRCAEILQGGVLGATICTTAPLSGRSCNEITCTGQDEGCGVTVLPNLPLSPTIATCIQDFEATTEGVRSGLRALGLIP